jgi:hypothetical protein
VGNVVLKLHEWSVDWACWCSYKYLNSGYVPVCACAFGDTIPAPSLSYGDEADDAAC